MGLSEHHETANLLDEEVECRNCHDTGGDDLIAPCACAGSIRYVHRSCLNNWRAVSPNENSFTNCDVCGTKYVFRERPDLRASRIRRFVLYFARDFLGAMLIVQAVIALLSTIAWGVDKDSGTMLRVFPSTWHPVAVYYVWGLFIFSLCAALYGFILGIYMCCSSDKSSTSGSSGGIYYNTYPYGWGYYYIWCWPYPGNYGGCCPACDCSTHGHQGCCGGCGGCACHSPGSCGSCGSSGGSDTNNSAMGTLALVVLIVGVVIGFIVMVVIATVIIRKHVKILRRYQDAREMEVVDLSKEGGIVHGSDQMV